MDTDNSKLDADQLAITERECGFCYPQCFRLSAGALMSLVRTPGFADSFPTAYLATSSDIKAAWAETLPDSLVPFMCEKQLAHIDYYCFNAAAGCGPQIVLFADHAVVYDWEDFDTFLDWVRTKCVSADT